MIGPSDNNSGIEHLVWVTNVRGRVTDVGKIVEHYNTSPVNYFELEGLGRI